MKTMTDATGVFFKGGKLKRLQDGTYSVACEEAGCEAKLHSAAPITRRNAKKACWDLGWQERGGNLLFWRCPKHRLDKATTTEGEQNASA